MWIGAFLTPDRVLLDLKVRSKAQLMFEIARGFSRSDPSIDAAAVEAAFLAREQLGSTGLGGGFALPHARIDAVPAFLGLFARLARPIEFEAIDGAPVGMVFALLMPGLDTSAHVQALASVSRAFRGGRLAEQLRSVRSAADGYQLLTGPPANGA